MLDGEVIVECGMVDQVELGCLNEGAVVAHRHSFVASA